MCSTPAGVLVRLFLRRVSHFPVVRVSLISLWEAMPALNNESDRLAYSSYGTSSECSPASSSSAHYSARCSVELSQESECNSSWSSGRDLYGMDDGIRPLAQKMSPVEPLGAPGLLMGSQDGDQSTLLLDIIRGARQMQDQLSVSADGPCLFGPTIDFKPSSPSLCTFGSRPEGLPNSLSLPISFSTKQKAGMLMNASPSSDMSSTSPYGSPMCYDVTMCCNDAAVPTPALMQQSLQHVTSWLSCSSPCNA